MKLLVLILAIGMTNSDRPHKISCDGIIFNHVYYDKVFVKGLLGRPYNLVYHKFSGILFFSHTIQTDLTVDFGIMACHVDKKQCMEIEGLSGGYAIAYDSGNDDIYMGGHDGIYKYNFLTRKAEWFAEKGKSIWSLFIRKNFYYIEYPYQKLHVYKNDNFVQVAEARNIELDHFYVSKLGDIYFANKTALYKVARPVREVIVLNDDLVIRQISEDGYGDIFFCASDGIYIEDKPYHRVKKLAHIDNAFGLAFDQNDHVIYSDRDTIYKLEPSNHSVICYNAIKAHTEEEIKRLGKNSRFYAHLDVL